MMLHLVARNFYLLILQFMDKDGIICKRRRGKNFMAVKRIFGKNGFLLLLLLVLVTNFSLYHTTIGSSFLPEQPNGVVIGSMIDLAIIEPILYMAWQRKWNWQDLIITMAGGLVLVRFLIPIEYLAPYEAITWVGFMVEGVVIGLELLLLATLFKYLPKVVRTVKNSTLPVIFAYEEAIKQNMKPSRIISIISWELLMFYYAFASWNKEPRLREHQFTLYKNSSLIASQVMIIHAIILETIAIHWWLHDRFFLLSLILLVVNIYSVIFFIGDIQALRYNALQVTEKGLYASLGLFKRMEIEWPDVEEMIDDPVILQQKRSKQTIEFIARDFEEVYPHVILKLKQPVAATFLIGKKKEYTQVAIRVDDPNKFKEIIQEKIGAVEQVK